MDYIKNQPDLNELRRRASFWAFNVIGRQLTVQEADQAIKEPAGFARRHQGDPSQICDLWSSMVCHAYLQEHVAAGRITTWRESEHLFDPNPGQSITGVILRLWPKIMGSEVTFCIFEGMNPRDGLMSLDGDDEISSILKQISEKSLMRIVNLIYDGSGPLSDLWLRALCEKEPINEEIKTSIYNEFYDTKRAFDFISMIEQCQSKSWTTSPIDSSYVKAKLLEVE